MRRLAVCFITFAAGLCLGEDAGRGVLLRIRDKAVEAILQTDHYICTQDLSRVYYVAASAGEACHQPPEPPHSPVRIRDRLKLDVAVSEGSEIYSWHGDEKFSGGAVGEIVRDGPISSGGFNGYLRNIFAERNVVFIFRGQQDGILHFDYRVPLESSHYQIEADNGFIVAPFHGSLSARADTYELVSVTVIADGDQIPKHVKVCALQSKLIYQQVPIAGKAALVPSEFQMMAGDRNKNFTVSEGKYTDCHEYRGESVVHFDDPVLTGDSSTPVAVKVERVPPGILLQVALKTTINEDSAFAGQPVEAVLLRNAKLAKGKVMPQGAVLRGFITGFHVYQWPQHYVSLKISFSSASSGGTTYLFDAVHENGLPLAPRRGELTFRPRDDESGIMIFDTPHLLLDHSFTTLLVTVAQPKPASR